MQFGFFNYLFCINNLHFINRIQLQIYTIIYWTQSIPDCLFTERSNLLLPLLVLDRSTSVLIGLILAIFVPNFLLYQDFDLITLNRQMQHINNHKFFIRKIFILHVLLNSNQHFIFKTFWLQTKLQQINIKKMQVN